MSLTPADSTLSVAPNKRSASSRSASKNTTSRKNDPDSTNTAGVASVKQLNDKLSEYLTPSEMKKVKEAYRFSDEMHLGQIRKSGEPYISHPIAVAEICADWKLEAQAI